MTDSELIELCKKGDREAFTELIDKYQTKVFNMSYGLLSNYEDAADATQEIFVKVYKSIPSFMGRSSFTTWLYVICRNVCNDILRQRKRRGISVSIYGDDEDDSKIADIPSDRPTPEEHAEMNERQAAVRDAVNSLKPEYREVIVYADMQQLSINEMAEIMKCPTGTVKSRLNRARSALRKKLSDKRELFS